MSIIIKGIELPKDIGDIISINLYDKKDNWLDNIEVERKDIIEIPTPHGRLIDADEFTDVCEILADKGGDIRPWEQAEWIAKDMPTILEAEE